MNADTIVSSIPAGYRWATALETERWTDHFDTVVQVRVGGTDEEPETDLAIRDDFDLVGAIMAYEAGESTALETLELFGYLVRTNKVWDLQGSYGRTAMALLEEGLIDPETGNITDLAAERLATLEEVD